MKNDMNPQCTVIILCYNEEQHISHLLSGIMQQTAQDEELRLANFSCAGGEESVANNIVKVI